MPKIDPEEYRKRLARITELFAGMVKQADRQSQARCPYRNRHDECTATFRCRNQRPPRQDGGAELCGHDGGLDYRSAWESDPNAYARAKERVGRVKAEAAKRRQTGRTKALDS
jgi:hypothetical protein